MGHDVGAPENFVGHPVADAGETALKKQHRFDRRPPVPAQEFAERAFAEVARMDLGRDRIPPRWSFFAVMETDAPKLPRIAKDERAFSLAEDEVIVHSRTEAGGFGAQIAAHPEMNAKPIVAGEDEEHLFPARLGAKEFLPNETTAEGARVGAAENPLFFV